MDEFEIEIPQLSQLSIDITDSRLYQYDFNSFSLVPLQEAAGVVVLEKIYDTLNEHIGLNNLIKKLANEGNKEYVANLSDYVQEKLTSGEWKFNTQKSTGETLATLVDTQTGRIQSQVKLDERIVKELGNLPELAAIQSQIATISEQIEDLNHLVQRVEQGQYNDRYAGFFSARQQIIEALVLKDDKLRRELLSSAIKTTNDTIGCLLLAIRQDALDFVDVKTKNKDARRIETHLQTSLSYLNSCVQLNLVSYTALCEDKALIGVLLNYQNFLSQIFLMPLDKEAKSLAWKLDNIHSGDDGNFLESTKSITAKISALVDDIKHSQIGGQSDECIETKDM